MNNKPGAREAYLSIRRQFGLSCEDADAEDATKLEEHVAEVVQQWLNTDMHKLFTSLYRLDVGEAQVKKVFAESPPQLVANELAKLIIDRELRKVQTRRRFSIDELDV